jgi:hypothetical protein
MKLLSTILFILVTNTIQAQVTVKMHSLTGYDGYESFANAACEKLQTVLNSDKFKQAILNGSFTKKDGLTNQQLWERIMKAHELQGPGGKDSVVDLRARIITLEQDGERWIKNCKPDSWAGTIGIDGQGDGLTAICPERLKNYYETKDTASLAAHYMHEYMHMLGFSHRGLSKRKSAVYKIGDIVEALIKEGV